MLFARLYNEDCFAAFAHLANSSVDAVITDPPYFLDKLGSNWETAQLNYQTKGGQVTSLPAGMKFDPKQGLEFQSFMSRISTEAMRVLKPGGFFLSFSAPRLYHRLAVAVEDAGFHVRDLWAWIYTQNQVKAMSVARFVDRLDGLSDEHRKDLKEIMAVWKTPQIKSCIEPIICAQKPPEGTFLENWIKNGVGLINTSARVGDQKDMFPANILTAETICGPLDRAFLVPKPSRAERAGAGHVSIKPLSLMEQLISLTVQEGAIVVDPFSGSGSTGIAALMAGRSYIGFELNNDLFAESQQRFLALLERGEWKADRDGSRVLHVSAPKRTTAQEPERSPA